MTTDGQSASNSLASAIAAGDRLDNEATTLARARALASDRTLLSAADFRSEAARLGADIAQQTQNKYVHRGILWRVAGGGRGRPSQFERRALVPLVLAQAFRDHGTSDRVAVAILSDIAQLSADDRGAYVARCASYLVHVVSHPRPVLNAIGELAPEGELQESDEISVAFLRRLLLYRRAAVLARAADAEFSGRFGDLAKEAREAPVVSIADEEPLARRLEVLVSEWLDTSAA